MARTETPINQERLEELCAWWQEVLGLRDWTIEAKLCRQWDMGGDNQGRFIPFPETKSAKIKVLDPIDHRDDWIPGTYDVESTLVHELLHIHFAPFWRDKKYMPQEQAINAIAKGYVTLKRQGVDLYYESQAEL